jgi:SAM-dependent methyltransferase
MKIPYKMKKITKKLPPNESARIFSENINYFTTKEESIWGHGEPETLEAIKKEDLKGKWLNIAAGDGRYNSELLEKVDFLVASDIDEGALSKLYFQTPPNLRNKLRLKAFDVNKRFPFKDGEFDGVFCTGFLHLFPESELEAILKEVKRIVKSDGMLFFDFATDVKRRNFNGNEIFRFGRHIYNLKQAKNLFKRLLKDFDTKMISAKLSEAVQESEMPYVLTCNFLIIIAQRK